MPGTVALVDHRGWWRAGAGGYVGPSDAPPAGPSPRRAALADARVQTLVVPPAELDHEIEAAFGPSSLVVTRELGEYRQQCVGAEERDVSRAEAWPGIDLIAPYPLAVLAWLTTQARGAATETRAIVERVGETLLITICQGPRIIAYRQTDSEPAGRAHEIRRTLLAVEALAGDATVSLAPDLLPMEIPDFTVQPLPAPCIALHGLARLSRRDGFVSRAAARALGHAGDRARLRRRALVTITAAALGGVVWFWGWIARQDAESAHRRLVAEAARLQREVNRLAPRKLGPLLCRRPLGQAGEVLAALPPGIGLVEASLEPDSPRMRLLLRFRPTDPLFSDPRTVRTVLTGFPSLTELEIRPSFASDGQVTWEAHAQFREGRARC